MLINHDSTNYRNFLSDDTVTCFLCKEKGHTSASCPMNENKNDTSENTSIMVKNDETNKYMSSPKINQPPQITNADEMITTTHNINTTSNEEYTSKSNLTIQQSVAVLNTPIGGIKRPAPLILSPTSSPPQFPTIKNNTPKKNAPQKINDRTIEQNTIKPDPKKKLKPSATEQFIDTLEEHLKPCKKIFNETKNIPINYDQFKLLI